MSVTQRRPTAADRFLLTRGLPEGAIATPEIGSVGTAGTNVTVDEFVDGLYRHIAILTLSSVAITIGDNAALAMGALIYTLPAGVQVIEHAYINVGLTLTTGTPTTDTPEMGLGTVVASGAVAVLGGTATFENIIAGASTPVLTNVAGAKSILTHTPNLKREAADVKTVYLNFADTWADVTNTAATASGTVVLTYTQIPTE